MTDEKHCISMNEDKCTEHGGRCEWKKVGKGNHKHHACSDKEIAPPPPAVVAPTVVAPVVPVAQPPIVPAPPDPQPPVPRQKYRFKPEKIKKKQIIKQSEGFVVGGLAGI